MAKFKPAKGPAGKKSTPSPVKPNAVGCIVLIAMLFFLLFLIMYFTIRQA
jgi:hypothetical protein